MEQPEILYDVTDGIATISFNRPDRKNAQTESSEILYLQLLQRADEDPAVKVVIVTGIGTAFCPGGDMDYLAEVAAAGGWRTSIPRPHCRFALNVRKPVVAAINGACAGSGLIYALMSDVRFAARGARFSTAFARRGLVGERGTTWLIAQIAGQGVARELMLSGRKFDADEALSLGLVNRVVEPGHLMDEARAWARDVAENCAPEALSIIKQQLLNDSFSDFEGSLVESGELGLMRMMTPDFGEGVRAFREGTRPAFAGVGGPNPAWKSWDVQRYRPG